MQKYTYLFIVYIRKNASEVKTLEQNNVSPVVQNLVTLSVLPLLQLYQVYNYGLHNDFFFALQFQVYEHTIMLFHICLHN